MKRDMAFDIKRRSRGASILFPLEPMLDESIRGYLARVADWNCFESRTDLLRFANLAIARDLSDRIAAEVSSLSRVLGIGGASLQRILQPTVGGNPEVVEYFGRPFLRRRFEFDARRISPASLSHSPHHRARWQIRLLPYCPESWEYLIDQCPAPACGKPLRWPECLQIDRCEHCEFDLRQARPGMVPQDLRDVLSLVGDLLHPTRALNAKALARLPQPFRDVAPHDLFEVLHILVRSLTPDNKEAAVSAEVAAIQLALAAQVLLDYPATIDRVAQEGSTEVDPRVFPLFLRVRRRGRGKDGIQKALLLSIADRAEAMHYGPIRVPRSREEDGEWTFDRSAAWLGISHSEFSKVIAAGLAQPSPRRGRIRHVGWIRPSEVQPLAIGLRQHMTAAEFVQSYDLPLSGMEQLVSLGFLKPCTEPIVNLLYPGFQLDRTSVLRFVDLVAGVLTPPLPDDVALEDVFHGIGGREKPWAAVIEGALDGYIPGGLGMEPNARLRFQRLTIPRKFAWDLLAGRHPGMLALPARSGLLAPPAGLSRIETQRYLNCSPRDLTWLLSKGHLVADGNGQSVRRAEVEAWGADFISAREISWRWRVSPEVREKRFAKLGIHRAVGPFWFRRAVEKRLGAFSDRQSKSSDDGERH